MAHLTFRSVLQGQWKLGPVRDGHSGLSAATEELGPLEVPPKGALRRCGWFFRQAGRRIWTEIKVEWPLAKPRLWVIIPCLIFQYIHAIFTGMAYYMHEPLPEDNTTLHDLGFEVFPYLSADWVSETLVYCGFAWFFAWAVSPFLSRRKSFHFVVVLKRVLVILVLCQVLRIVTFLSTQIPAPAPHCRAPESTSNEPWPVWWRVIIVNVSRQASKGCGDLIFSSHLTFILTFTWTYAVLGQYYLLKIAAFLYALATAFCIIASRKHYTVDCTVAFYVVPLVYFHFCRKWTTARDDVCTNDNRGVVALDGPSLPLANGGSEGGSKGGALGRSASSGSALGAASRAGSRQHSAAALGGGGGGALGGGDLESSAAAAAGSGEVRLDLELAQRQSSAPLVLEGEAPQRPESPVKAAVRRTWDAVAGLPATAARAVGKGPTHRRTESMEPVLLAEDQSTGSVGR